MFPLHSHKKRICLPPSLRHVHTLLLTYSRMTSVNTLTQTILHLCTGLARHLVALGAATGCGLPSRHRRGALSPQGSQQAQLRHGLSLPCGIKKLCRLTVIALPTLGAMAGETDIGLHTLPLHCMILKFADCYHYATSLLSRQPHECSFVVALKKAWEILTEYQRSKSATFRGIVKWNRK